MLQGYMGGMKVIEKGVGARPPPRPPRGGNVMRILVTNDDGIHAQGLDICRRAIARALSDDVWIDCAGNRSVGRCAFAVAQ